MRDIDIEVLETKTIDVITICFDLNLPSLHCPEDMDRRQHPSYRTRFGACLEWNKLLPINGSRLVNDLSKDHVRLLDSQLIASNVEERRKNLPRSREVVDRAVIELGLVRQTTIFPVAEP